MHFEKEQSMKRIKVRIEGRTPLMMCPMPEETLEALWKRKRSAAASTSEMSYEQAAARQVIKDEKGRIALPTTYFYGAFVEAGRKVTLKGRANVSTAETTELYSFFEIEGGEYLPLSNGTPGEEPTWVVDKRPGRNLNAPGKPACCVIRPKFPQWSVDMVIAVDTEVDGASISVARQIVERAGRVGVGAFRPSKRGPFGQFRIAEWTEIDEAGEPVPVKEK